MSEQEHIFEYEQEHEQEQTSSREHLNIIKHAGAEEIATGYESIGLEDLDEIQERRAARWPGRVLVAALGVSFLVCLAALWFSGTLLSAPDQLSSLTFFAETHRLLVLLVPAVCLVICYGLLRSRTREIMAVPERYLDERQKMLRDQAHRSAFNIIKIACLLVPLGFILPHLPWFNQPAPVAISPLTFTLVSPDYTGHPVTANNLIVLFHMAPGWAAQPFIPPATTAEIVLAVGLLLLCLLLIVSALPKAVLAWKGKN